MWFALFELPKRFAIKGVMSSDALMLLGGFACLLVSLAGCVNSATTHHNGEHTVLSLPEVYNKIAANHLNTIDASGKRLIVGYFSYEGREINELGELIAKSLPYHIKQMEPGIRIYSRRKLNQAIRELNLQSTDLFDQDTALQLGRFVGAQWLLSGDLNRFGDHYAINSTLMDIETLETLTFSNLQFRFDDPAFERTIENNLLLNTDLALPIEDFGAYATDYLERVLQAEFYLERGRYQRAMYSYNAAITLNSDYSIGYLGRASARIAQIRELLTGHSNTLPMSSRLAINQYLASIKSDFETARGLIENGNDKVDRAIVTDYLQQLLAVNRQVMKMLEGRY